jgi:2-polyprenyl-3-methyl-5-hydroxy-6-metoxy-1,4-benzoquinol methylase
MQSPLSKSANCSLIKTIDPGEIAARWRKELSIDWFPDPAIGNIQYWHDNESGFCFYEPKLAAGDETLYMQLQKFPWYYMEDKWEFKQAIKLLSKSTQDTSPRILEIGVGKGAFLEQAQQAGFNICGVELNPDGAESARRKGFVIYEENLASLCSEHAKAWDALCAFQVLEHLSEPRAFLEQALILLKPGGSLILSVPNADVASELDPSRNDLLDQPPHHMTHWNEKIFKYLETLFPMRLADTAFEPLAPYHIDWFMGAWSMRMRESVGRFPQKIVFNRFSLPLLRAFIATGPRKLIRGHTLLVRFVKL